MKEFEYFIPQLNGWLSLYLEDLLLILFSKEKTIILHQLSNHEECVESNDTIADEPYDIFSLCIVFTLQEYLIPEGGEFGVVLLEFVQQLILSHTDLIERPVFSDGFLDG